MTALLITLVAVLLAGAQQVDQVTTHKFTAATDGEAVATIAAGCERCDWSAQGREAVLVRVMLDDEYSQHLLLVRGAEPAPYRVLLGPVSAGEHRITLARDETRSARQAGALTARAVGVTVYARGSAEHEWLSQAPFVHARPGTVERFSDLPVLAWVERAPAPATGYRYSIIFTHEDGGTPTDRLMATWGRTTDIEFVFGAERGADGTLREEIQGKNHDILPFAGRRIGRHPLLWVATENNMVSDSGPADAVRFGPAPELVSLAGVSREAVMDKNPWTYAIMAAELRREGRIDAAAEPGSAKVPDPRRFAYLEACGELDRATVAFDVATLDADGTRQWHPTDRGDVRFRVARSGCFRVAVPVPEGVTIDRIGGVRVRAFTRPRRDGESAMPAGTGRVTLKRLNGVFMLDEHYRPGPAMFRWAGVIAVRGESGPASIPRSPADRKR
jgi:hypothetical protein